MRRIDLTEEVPHQVPDTELGDDSVRTLLGWSGFEVGMPTFLTGPVYTIRSAGWVGYFPTADSLIAVTPKVPVQNLLGMLDVAYRTKSFGFYAGSADVDTLDDLIERLASLLAKRVIDRVRRGLYRSYVGEEDRLQNVRGKLRTVDTAVGLARGRVAVECRYEELTADVPDNQILFWTIMVASRWPMREGQVRRDLRVAYHALAGTVSPRPFWAQQCEGRSYNRLNADYRDLHLLCGLILRLAAPSLGNGRQRFTPFGVYMPELFELYVAEWLKAELPERYRLLVQPRYSVSGNYPVEFRADLVILRHEDRAPIAVLDTKYKSGKLYNADLYQVVSYATEISVSKAIVIYPDPDMSGYRLNFGPEAVKVSTLGMNISGDLGKGAEKFIEALLSELP